MRCHQVMVEEASSVAAFADFTVSHSPAAAPKAEAPGSLLPPSPYHLHAIARLTAVDTVVHAVAAPAPAPAKPTTPPPPPKGMNLGNHLFMITCISEA